VRRDAADEHAPGSVTRIPPSHAFTATGVVAVLRAPEVDGYLPVVEALADAGVRCIELTLTTPRTIERLPWLLARLPADLDVGIGTVRTEKQAAEALDAGARFLVTPTVNPSVVTLAVGRGAPVYPGAMTPTEVLANWDAGASAVKVFPASTVGADVVKQLHGPFPEIALMPSGGVGLDAIGRWIAAGAVAVSLGGPMIGDAFSGGDLTALRSRARAALDAVAEARS
jgi:2-dehydro-3-deoxyphosphogluconate aldolase/(4S)-4-hydroxy-2-oxoglutarate aldolase